jgi:DNA polymerase-3 subunit alpha
MAQQREIFTRGATERGVNAALATQLFDLMEKFAEYGFNKSHSAAYALVAYHTAWLKAHYLAEFMAASLSSDMDDTDKVKIFVEDCINFCEVPLKQGQAAGMNGAKLPKLKLLPPDVNQSNYRFTPIRAEGELRASAIRYGFGAVKGTGQGACEAIMAERATNGPFKSVFDFAKRVDRKQVNRRVMEGLARAGAFDCVHPDRASVLATVPRAIEWAEAQAASASQVSLFGDINGEEATPDMVQLPAWDDRQKLSEEKIALGFYLSGHLFHADAHKIRPFIKTSLKSLSASRDLQWMAGVASAIRTQMTKRGKMAFVVLDDATDQVEISVFNELFDANRSWLKEDTLLIVRGKVSDDAYTGGLRVVADRLFNLTTARAQFVRGLALKMNGQSSINLLKSALEPFVDKEAGCTVEVQYHNQNAACAARLCDQWKVRPDEALIVRLKSWLGDEAVEWVY